MKSAKCPEICSFQVISEPRFIYLKPIRESMMIMPKGMSAHCSTKLIKPKIAVRQTRYKVYNGERVVISVLQSLRMQECNDKFITKLINLNWYHIGLQSFCMALRKIERGVPKFAGFGKILQIFGKIKTPIYIVDLACTDLAHHVLFQQFPVPGIKYFAINP